MSRKFIVYTNESSDNYIYADRFVISDSGDLIFLVNGANVRAHAKGTWVQVRLDE